MRIAILGNGGFGTAIALTLERAGHAAAIWGHDPIYTAEVAATRRNPRYLDEVALPDSIRVTSDGAAVLERCEAVLVAVPTQHVRATLTGLARHVPGDVPVVSLCKGIEQESGRRPSEVLAEVVGRPARVFALSGPSHAEEVARGLPTTVVIAGP
ncbi:MAG: NAD(P)-binding domain-containing protein, partial [Planctomycetes bacterium]|nr:NAD(P)-binding domain-containing protein [Planctomycetota bacterium]